MTGPRTVPRKLRKPPQVRAISRKPRNRLQKQATPSALHLKPSNDLYVLEYEPDTTCSEPGKVLGVYSTFDSVTLGALEHGAYTFSRNGLLAGNEYLSATGRIKFVETTVQRAGVKAPIPVPSIPSVSPNGDLVRLDIPHPESQQQEAVQAAGELKILSARDKVFVAHRKGPQAASWMGVYADPSLAWGACLKDKAVCAVSGALCDEVRTIVANNMPQITARLIGSGRLTWTITEHVVNGLV
jgi:hypothetical protein